MDAREALDERRLARAVVADEAEHLAAAKLEVDAVERPHGAVRLGDPARLQDDLARSHCLGHRTTSRAAFASWSTTEAAITITPTTISCQKSGTFVRIMPL